MVLVNGEFVPEEQAVVSVFDRGFLYGDGIFEGVLCRQGRPFRWQAHMDRLRRGAEYLGIPLRHPAEQLHDWLAELTKRNGSPDCFVRINLSRGVGLRGYSPKGADRPTLVISTHPAPSVDPADPPWWRLATASVRVPAGSVLALHKSSNKLAQVLARMEAEAAGANEGLLLNSEGKVAETASGNLFWLEGGKVCTTPLGSGILAGVTRQYVMEMAEGLGLAMVERAVTVEELVRAEGVMVTLSSMGVVGVSHLDGRALARSERTRQLSEAYWRGVEAECSPGA